MDIVFNSFEDLQEFAVDVKKLDKVLVSSRYGRELERFRANMKNRALMNIKQQMANSPANIRKQYQTKRMRAMSGNPNTSFESLQDLQEFASYRKNALTKREYLKNEKGMKSRKRCPECGKKNCNCE